MATIITMPRLSDTMTEGVVAKWLKKEGDSIAEGDIIAEIETDKATMEFESFDEGTLLYVGLKEGEGAPVDSLLAIIGEEGENVETLISEFKNNTGKSEVANSDESSEATATKEIEDNTDSAISSGDGQRIKASPLAKKIAKEKGVQLSQVEGSGESGRIIKRDVENYSAPKTVAPTQTFSPESGEISIEEIANSQMRKTIAKRLTESKFSAPHYYLMIEVDMDQAILSRKSINELPNTKVSFNDLVVKACAMALKKHPKVNSQWTETKTIINHHINIGVAVAVEDGLVVPVIPFTETKGLVQLGTEIKDKAIRAKDKKLTPAEMEGSTFTVSNLGMFGITEFTSIINQPNAAILSVGTIIQKPVVKNGEIVVGNTMKLTLACDHRTVDGATGAAFLQTLKQFIENPVVMLT